MKEEKKNKASSKMHSWPRNVNKTKEFAINIFFPLIKNWFVLVNSKKTLLQPYKRNSTVEKN